MAKILVIDDEPSVRASVELILKAAGHKLIIAADGAEGVRRYQAEPSDLVITDMFMPDQDGVETITQFHILAPKVPIIAMSGNPKGNTLTIAQKLGAVAVLEKPFSVQQLVKA